MEFLGEGRGRWGGGCEWGFYSTCNPYNPVFASCLRTFKLEVRVVPLGAKGDWLGGWRRRGRGSEPGLVRLLLAQLALAFYSGSFIGSKFSSFTRLETRIKES